MQKTNFPIGIIIYDDTSADGTADIISRSKRLKTFNHHKVIILQTYLNISPGKNIRLIVFQTENVVFYSVGENLETSKERHLGYAKQKLER